MTRRQFPQIIYDERQRYPHIPKHSRRHKIDVRLEDETVWLTQVQLATLFGKGRSAIAEHIGNVFDEGELEQNRTCRKFRQVRRDRFIDAEREIFLSVYGVR